MIFCYGQMYFIMLYSLNHIKHFLSKLTRLYVRIASFQKTLKPNSLVNFFKSLPLSTNDSQLRAKFL